MIVTEFKMGLQKLKPRIVAYCDYKYSDNEKFKVRRYQQKIEQYKKVESSILKMYAEFNGDGVRPIDVPSAKESKKFWGDIWSIRKRNNRDEEWLKKELRTGC